MRIDELEWVNIAPYLKKARGQSDNTLLNHRSRFKVLKLFFKGRDFDSKNLAIFLTEVETLGKSSSYQNNVLKLCKHLAHYLGNPQEFEDFKYINEGDSTPEIILSPQEIVNLAECEIKYRYFNTEGNFKKKVLIYFLGNVGSRIDETLNLEWGDLMASETPMIHFRAEITKTKRERFCPVPKWLFKMLLHLPKDGLRVFSQIEAGRFRQDLEKRRLKCHLPIHITPHTFRDSSINNKLEYGMPIQLVASYHGHVKIDTTFKFYTKIQAQQMAYSLQQYDPSFVSDQSYETNILALKGSIEKQINPKVTRYIYESKGDETVIRLVKKI